jgi:hypothetical protein
MVRSGNVQGELAQCLGMSRTASTLADEMETLFALSEAYERKGDTAAAARSLLAAAASASASARTPSKNGCASAALADTRRRGSNASIASSRSRFTARRAGSQAATQHLISLGHERIGYLGGDVMYSSNRDRWQGYLEALRKASLRSDEELVKLGTNRGTWGAMAANELLRLASPPTAIFVASYAIMPGVIRSLRQAGVALPEEMSLICFDDVDWFSLSVPPITAISTAYTTLAEAAVDLLLARVAVGSAGAERPPVFMEVNFEFVLRRSTAAPRSGPLHYREAPLSESVAGEV